MKKTRRKFLCNCTLIVGSVAMVPALATAQTAKSVARPVGAPGVEQFRRLLNTRFTVLTGDGVVDVKLMEVRELARGAAGSKVAGNESFSLKFHGSRQAPLSQDTYTFAHSELGELAIFIVPVGLPAPSYCCYEAVFNRPASAAELAWQIAGAPRRVVKG